MGRYLAILLAVFTWAFSYYLLVIWLGSPPVFQGVILSRRYLKFVAAMPALGTYFLWVGVTARYLIR